MSPSVAPPAGAAHRAVGDGQDLEALAQDASRTALFQHGRCVVAPDGVVILLPRGRFLFAAGFPERNCSHTLRTKSRCLTCLRLSWRARRR